jgi:uncharacterized protein YoaH (UPF0181 family)
VQYDAEQQREASERIKRMQALGFGSGFVGVVHLTLAELTEARRLDHAIDDGNRLVLATLPNAAPVLSPNTEFG